MTPTRAALAIPAVALVLSGCGAASAITAHTVSETHPLANVASEPLRALPRPAVHTVAPPPPAPPATAPPTSAYLVATVSTSSTAESIEILSASGAVVAKAAINPDFSWLTAAGVGGAYWTQSGAEYELTVAGKVLRLGAVPADANGVVIGADGKSYAYATSDGTAGGVATNRIVVVRPGKAAQVIADRVSDPNHPSADAPPSWDYYLMGWTSTGISFARVPTGGCGCGAFDMQMQSAFSGVIDPTSLVVTALPTDASCPLSAMGPGMEIACFTGTASSTGLRVATGSTINYHFAMSGANIAGDTVFSPTGSALAYVTIPTSENSCGVTWTTTLRVLTLSTGHAVSRVLAGFSPSVWAPNGVIYGSLASSTGQTELVAVNPATLAVTRIAPNSLGANIVGII
jgi:hypothetical protein